MLVLVWREFSPADGGRSGEPRRCRPRGRMSWARGGMRERLVAFPEAAQADGQQVAAVQARGAGSLDPCAAEAARARQRRVQGAHQENIMIKETTAWQECG